MDEGIATLTDKETLRLILRGHDAKSMARELGLSVHTINERLRNARRKLDVTSSREAARLLFERETRASESVVYKRLGDASSPCGSDDPSTVQPARPGSLWIGVIVIMLSITIAAALALSDHPADDRPTGDPATAVETVQIEHFEAVARSWLALVDLADWDASFAAAGRSFRDPNTIAMWRDASEQARAPLGAMIERKAMTVDFVQSGTDRTGAESGEKAIVRFATHFENRRDAVETVTLEQEHGEWKVVGYLID